MKRPKKEEYYLSIAQTVSARATCIRRKYGAVLVVDDEIRGTGYCGSPRGCDNCIDLGYCRREEEGVPSGERYEYCNSVHAEMNVVISVARRDASGGTLYLYADDLVGGDQHYRVEPCIMCKRVIINAGIKKVVTANKAGDVLRFRTEDWVADGSFMLYGKKEEKNVTKPDS